MKDQKREKGDDTQAKNGTKNKTDLNESLE